MNYLYLNMSTSYETHSVIYFVLKQLTMSPSQAELNIYFFFIVMIAFKFMASAYEDKTPIDFLCRWDLSRGP